MEDPRRRKGDWKVNADLLAEEIEAIWPVRLVVRGRYVDIDLKKKLYVAEATAVLTPPVNGLPASLRTIVPIDRTYLTPHDRATYMSLFQLWIALEAIGLPPRRQPD